MKIQLTSTGAYLNGKMVDTVKEHKTLVAMMLHKLQPFGVVDDRKDKQVH